MRVARSGDRAAREHRAAGLRENAEWLSLESSLATVLESYADPSARA